MVDSAIDSLFFVVGGFGAVWLAYILFRESFSLGWGQIVFSVVFWVLLAYLVLPRLHRILTRIYVPNYFIGRARTSDGLLGDPVNLALLGSESQLHEVMSTAGWVRADDVTMASGIRIARSTILRRSYLEAPVSPLMLFERVQDFAYQQEVNGSPGKRHHVRFWRCPPGWMLPGGRPVDWLAAGTYDRSVGFSLFTLQVTHKIDEHTDAERDHIVASVAQADPSVTVSVIEDFSTGYHSRNGGGDSIVTDGDLPILDLTAVRVDERAANEEATDSRNKRPAPTIVGAVMLAGRALPTLSLVVVVMLNRDELARSLVDGNGSAAPQLAALIWAVAGALGLFAAADALLAWRTFLGRNWARVAAMGLSTASMILQAVSLAAGGPAITLNTNLAGLALDILLVIALSSDRARIYARRRRKDPKRISGRPGDVAAF